VFFKGGTWAIGGVGQVSVVEGGAETTLFKLAGFSFGRVWCDRDDRFVCIDRRFLVCQSASE
jgi:hypothetical protein